MCDALRFMPLAALAAAASIASAQDPRAAAPPAFEVTPFIGYRTGGEFEHATTGEELDIDESETFALALNLRIDALRQYELFYSRQSGNLERGTSLGPVGVDIEYFHIGGTLVVDDTQPRFRPFIVGTLGATRFNPEPPEGEDEIKFSFSLGGGLRIGLSERFALRLEARGYLTFIDSDSSIFCASGAFGGVCTVRASGDTFIQYEALLGAAFAF